MGLDAVTYSVGHRRYMHSQAEVTCRLRCIEGVRLRRPETINPIRLIAYAIMKVFAELRFTYYFGSRAEASLWMCAVGQINEFQGNEYFVKRFNRASEHLHLMHNCYQVVSLRVQSRVNPGANCFPNGNPTPSFSVRVNDPTQQPSRHVPPTVYVSTPTNSRPPLNGVSYNARTFQQPSQPTATRRVCNVTGGVSASQQPPFIESAGVPARGFGNGARAAVRVPVHLTSVLANTHQPVGRRARG